MTDTPDTIEAGSPGPEWQERLAQSHLAICRDYERQLEAGRAALATLATIERLLMNCTNVISLCRSAGGTYYISNGLVNGEPKESLVSAVAALAEIAGKEGGE